jgi:hypothetical protein
MTVFAGLVLRNLRITFRSRATLLFILLPLLILAVLYPFWIVGLHADAVAPLANGTDADWLAQGWTAAGLPIVLSFTGAMGALGVLARDRHERRSRDFGTTGLRAAHRALGYAGATVLSACLTGLVAYVVLQLSIHLYNGLVPDPRMLIFGFGYTMLGSLHAAAFCLFLVSLLRGGGIYAALSGAVGVLAGFATGAFVPVGMAGDCGGLWCRRRGSRMVPGLLRHQPEAWRTGGRSLLEPGVPHRNHVHPAGCRPAAVCSRRSGKRLRG